MTKQQKDLLLKDLCARLPYNVRCLHKEDDGEDYIDTIIGFDGCRFEIEEQFYDVEDFKPYLRPMSSMTKEEKEELRSLLWFGYPSDDYDNYSHRGIEVKQCLYDDERNPIYDFDDFRALQNFLLKNHFDYCGLIEKGLALEATEGMYN